MWFRPLWRGCEGPWRGRRSADEIRPPVVSATARSERARRRDPAFVDAEPGADGENALMVGTVVAAPPPNTAMCGPTRPPRPAVVHRRAADLGDDIVAQSEMTAGRAS